MKVIDFRFRPNTHETMIALSKSSIFREGLIASGRDLTEFVQSAESMDDIAQSLINNNGISAIIVGRDAETTYDFKPNHNEILPFIERDSSLFRGFAGADPHKGMQTVYLISQLIKQGFSGVAIDPMYAQLRVDDARYYPIYAKCCELDIPIIITTGLSPLSPIVSIDAVLPIYIDRVDRKSVV